jgi:hypothetical protein
MDMSTLNVAELRKLKIYKLLGTYHLQQHPGGGYFLDPPGFPTYFTRAVYTKNGNSPPRNRVQTVISFEGVDYALPDPYRPGETWEKQRARWDALMHRLYIRLPFEHPRVLAWVSVLFGYFRNSYEDPSKPAEIRSNVAELLSDGPDAQHRAVIKVREIYPEVSVDALAPWIDSGRYGSGGPGDWWERDTKQPSIEDCHGLVWMHGNTGHRAEGWCQFCGRVDNQPA